MSLSPRVTASGARWPSATPHEIPEPGRYRAAIGDRDKDIRDILSGLTLTLTRQGG